MLKVYLKCYGLLYGLIIILTFLLSILNYYTNNSFMIINLIIPTISILMSTIILGKKATNKAYIEGIKFSSIYIIISIILNIIFKTFNIKIIIFNIILLFIGALGAMTGINLKRK